VNIIPNVAIHDLINEIDEMRKASEGYNTVKNNLIDFKNMVAWILSLYIYEYYKYLLNY
jgi:hypothetical protein